jgi:hypothetical protein
MNPKSGVPSPPQPLPPTPDGYAKLADEIERTIFYREIDVLETDTAALRHQIADYIRSKALVLGETMSEPLAAKEADPRQDWATKAAEEWFGQSEGPAMEEMKKLLADTFIKHWREAAPPLAPQRTEGKYFGPCPKCGVLLGFGHLPETCTGAVAQPEKEK